MSWHKLMRRMNWRIILNLVGYVLFTMAALMLLPLGVSLLYRETCWMSFFVTIILCLVLSIPLMNIHAKQHSYFAKDGLIAVGFYDRCPALLIFSRDSQLYRLFL